MSNKYTGLSFAGRTVIDVIEELENHVMATPIGLRQKLYIKEVEEDYGNPFCQNPDKKLVLAIKD